MKKPAYLLPVIIVAQFMGTSLWFAGNAVVPDLQQLWGLGIESIGYVTISVHLGFIVGTLIFAVLGVADRYSPRKVFFWSCFTGAIANVFIVVLPGDPVSLMLLRFVTGFFLAGIYPVGMKITAAWYEKGLGNALGLLVGALVLGTAFPHLLRALAISANWEFVLIGTSIMAFIGGLLILLFVPDGPFLASAAKFNFRAITAIFQSRKFRASALGYFGHMWELYALWAFLPLWVVAYSIEMPTQVSGQMTTADSIDIASNINVSLWTFVFIAAGVIGCVAGGIISKSRGSDTVAASQLMISGTCCILSPLVFTMNIYIFVVFLLIWGITVIGDSPQFSALNAINAPRDLVGSALTLVNSIGFFISICSIALMNGLLPYISPGYIFWILVPGPILGLWGLRGLRER